MFARLKEVCSREFWVEFNLKNKHLLRDADGTTTDKSPCSFVFVIGNAELNEKIRAPTVAICLPVTPLVKTATQAQDVLDGLIASILALQSEGPYTLVGYCATQAIALKVATELVSRGHEVPLLILIEPYGFHDSRLITVVRRLMLLFRCPGEGIGRLVTGLRRRLAFHPERSPLTPNPEWERVSRCNSRIDALFENSTARGEADSPRFPGRVALIFGDRSLLRFWPAPGLRAFIHGDLEVHTVQGDHYCGLFEGEELARKVEQCVAEAVCPRGSTRTRGIPACPQAAAHGA